MAKIDLTQKELPAHPEPLGLPAHNVKGAIAGRKAAAVPAAAASSAPAASTADVDEATGGFRWGFIAALAGIALVLAGFFFFGNHDSMNGPGSDAAYLAGSGGKPHTYYDAAGYRIVTASPGNDAVIESPVRLEGVMSDGISAEIADEAGDVNAAVEEVAVAPVTSAQQAVGPASGMTTATADASSATAASTAGGALTKVIYLFKFGSDGIRENAPLNNLAAMAREKDKDVTIVAYTDEKGSPSFNQRLSEERAKAVGDYLIAHGVPAENITTIGKGATHAYATDALDRRAVVTIN